MSNLMEWRRVSDQTQHAVTHARPRRCPRCREHASVLLFDSWPVGMVCGRCHEGLIGMRNEALRWPSHLRAGVLRSQISKVNDSWLTAKTKVVLFADDQVKSWDINVETKHGTVMLRGKVDTPEAKTAMEEITQGIKGVVKEPA